MIASPSDDAIWASIATTLREVVLPQIDDPWTRQTTVQLIGLAEYARRRSSAPASPTAASVEDDTAAAAELIQLLSATDEASFVRRRELRAALVAELDAALEESSMLLNPFRGKLPDA